jgi:hypothetical protein
VLFECLTGRTPFSRDSELAVLWAHIQEPPPKATELDPTLPAEIDGVIATALAKDPEQRYATSTALVHAAREALGVDSSPSRGVSRGTITIAAAAVLIALAPLAAGLSLAIGGGNARAKPNLVVKTNTLVRINPKTNKIADVIPVGRNPESLAYGGNTVWVYNNADHTVEGIDTETNAIAVPATAISGDAPRYSSAYAGVAADQEGAWVLSVEEPSGRGLLTRVRRDVPSTDQFHLSGAPVAIAFGDGSIWVTTTKGRTGALLRIDPRTRAVRTLVLPGRDTTPNSIAVGAGAVWLTDAGVPHSYLFRIDPRTMRITGRRPISCSRELCALAIGPGSVWIVANPEAGPFRLLRVDPRTLQVTGGVHTHRSDVGTYFALGFSFVPLDGNTIWYVGDEAVRVDTRTSRIVATIHLNDHPNLFAMASAIVTGGGSVWTAIAAPR